MDPVKRPNILMIVAHDTGRHLGCYGVPACDTQNLDQLAADGVLFKNFFSTAPQCSPARASLFTGRYPHSHGVIGISSSIFGFDLNSGEKHLVEFLKTNGFRTALAGIAHETLSLDRLSFDHVAPPGTGEQIAERSIELLAKLKKCEEPFYLQIGFNEAHRPFHDSYSEKGIHVPPWLVDEPSAREDLAGFQGSIRRLDQAVGCILDYLDGNELRENTLVVFLADHGMPYPRAKHSLYEPGCEIAALMRCPAAGWCGGRSCPQLLSGVDLLPTLLDVLGIPKPDNLEGRSFWGLLNEEENAERDEVFTEQNFNAYFDVSRAIRSTSFKMIANFSPGRCFYDSTQEWRPPVQVKFLDGTSQPRTQHPSFELFDLTKDPLESTNRAGQPEVEEEFAALKEKLYRWMLATSDPLLKGLPQPPIYKRTLSGLIQR